MAEVGPPTWATGFWDDDFWVDQFWRDDDSPGAPAVDQPNFWLRKIWHMGQLPLIEPY